MKPPYFILLLSILLSFASSIPAACVDCRTDMYETRQSQVTREGWELQSDYDAIKVYNRKVHGSGIREVLALTVINLPATKLFDTISDYNHYQDFMPYVQKSEIKSSSKNKNINVYQRLDFPWPISNRYYTIELTPDTTQAHLGHYTVSWTLSQDNLPQENGVQIKVNDGYWQFCTVGKYKTFVEYYLHTDPGGILPQWAINQANNRAVPEVIRALQHRTASTIASP